VLKEESRMFVRVLHCSIRPGVGNVGLIFSFVKPPGPYSP